ncbi:hypothetical protein FRACYDRAFT_234244 [Fragilariopsis cylindrus CCMP1102]|uniref:Uncharacterized protein n=1 Tax=Fragilariopsis cylindrus CCMP1102 TaxID=635003 RepID=A0A1E7FR14_9STRA|nr:hypothetical protein FRACYDRAFT_234244 [Fragilariopsis cylindrus CCMP1102]|eukprot:OEU20612.1 hypothetical protein FRACYDRAFT_234244 [Fragilariopsis cylindrus CCMP1102]
MASTGKSSDIIHKLKLLSKTHCSNSNKRRKLLKRVVISSSASALGEADNSTGNDVALNRYLELIPTTTQRKILPIENSTTASCSTTKDEDEGKDAGSLPSSSPVAGPELEIKLVSSKSTATVATSEIDKIKQINNNDNKGETTVPITSTNDDCVIGAVAAVTETTIQKQLSDSNGPIEKEKKESDADNDNDNSTKTTTKICLINQEDIKRYEEMEDEQINAIQKIDEARNEFYKDQVQKVWGVYTYGLNHVLGLNDLSDAPDAILPGNFLSPPKEVK